MEILLSVCIIAKNSESTIENCLKSVYNIADEIIFVDTGSTDNTINIAKNYTDKIYNFTWEDNFSQARNFSLEQAKGKYILILDSDEELSNPNELINTLNNLDDNIGGLLIRVNSYKINPNNQVEKMSTDLLRVFLNHPEIRFKGRIHEQVFDSIVSLGLKIENSNISIYHSGYNLNANDLKIKQERNLRLLKLALEEDPTNLYLLNHLAKTLVALGSIDDAIKIFKIVVERSEDVGTYTIESMNYLTSLYIQSKKYEDAIKCAEKSLSKLPNQVLPYFHLGDINYYQHKYDIAYQNYKKCLSLLQNENSVSNIIGQSHIPLEQIHFKIGETLSALAIYDDAITSYENGLSNNPTDVFCLLGIVNVLIKTKKLELAQAFFTQVKNIHPNNEFVKELDNRFFQKNQPINQPFNKNYSKKALLSLAMIVKNEEEFLEGCLQSVQGLADEIIIIDTGSTDKTLEIAQKYTNNIYHFEWIDDFAAARNEAIKHCTGDWILYLDADERLKVTNKNAFLNFIKELPGDIGGVNCIIESRHYKLDNDTEIHRGGYPRLFRNLGFPRIEFRGRVHEQISPSLLEQGMSFVNSDILIEHLGYNQDREVMEQKVKRNYKLLLQHIQEQPTNGYAWYQLGQTLAQMKLNKEAEEAVRFAIDCKNLSKSVMASAAATLSQLTGNQKKFEEALHWAEVSLENAPEQIYAAHLKAYALLYLNRFSEAETLFREILKKINRQKGMPMSGFDIEIPTDVIIKGLEKAINKNANI